MTQRTSREDSPASTSKRGTRNSLSMVPTLFSTVRIRDSFFSSSTRPTSSLKGSSSSRRLT